MKSVTVSKERLKETLEKNRALHTEEFEKAWAGYRKKVIETLEENLDSVKGDGPIKVNVNLVQPRDHTEDYDTALKMLEWEESESLELDYGSFCNLVLDDWGWKDQFTTTNAMYSG